MSSKVQLNRSLTLTQMVLYGLGTTIGAGIYALVADLAGMAGYFSPISFLISALIAGLTALSFAEMSSRYPQAAGTAIYVKQGFGSVKFSTLTGLLVCLAGLTSASALLNGFVGYLSQFINLPPALVIIAMTLLLGAVIIKGIQTSANFAAFFTLIEVGGLLLIIGVSFDTVIQIPGRIDELIPSLDWVTWHGIFAGSLLAFYAFIGFEDMVVVAEEVKDASRTLPRAIMITLGITLVVYMLIMVIAVLSVPPQQLKLSDAPLSELFKQATGADPVFINIIALLALVNGILIQMIMASRLLYGLSTQHQLPRFLSQVSSKTQTPVHASLVVMVVMLIMAISGGLAQLAELTSFIMLIVFSLVNLALWRIKSQHKTVPHSHLNLPIAVPILGFIVNTAFVLYSLQQVF